jgi:hypothetical protein
MTPAAKPSSPNAPVLPETRTLPIEDIAPYWRNPRRIPEAAVTAVATSIQDYGYVQPIVVDRANVVIVGHTRLQALKRLGVREVQVYVSDLPEDKAREYRLVDNKTGEMTEWDHHALVLELREFDQSLLDQFFPEVDLEVEMIDSATGPSEEEIAWKNDKVTTVKAAPVQHMTAVVCPSCFHSFQVRTSSLPGLSRDEVADLADDGDGDGDVEATA